MAGLFRGEPGDGRQHPEGVGGQHEDHFRPAAAAGAGGAGDVGHRVGSAGVLGELGAVEVEPPGFLPDLHILQDGAEAAGGGVDLRLAGAGEADDLGVAAALEVEDAVRAPAVFVVADEGAAGVGGEGGLPGAGEAEEDRQVFPVGAVVGGTVHREDAALREEVVHHREHRLLDLAGVGGAADQDLAALEVHDHEDFGSGLVLVGGGAEAGGGDHRELRAVFVERFLVPGADEHVPGEEALPGLGGDDPDGESVLGVGAGVAVLDEQVAALEVGGHPPAQAGVPLGGEGVVVATPPDVGVGVRFADHVLVVRGAAGELAGAHHDGAAVGQRGFAAEDRLLGERRGGQVPEHPPGVADAAGAEVVAAPGEAEVFGGEVGQGRRSRGRGSGWEGGGGTGSAAGRRFDGCREGEAAEGGGVIRARAGLRTAGGAVLPEAQGVRPPLRR